MMKNILVIIACSMILSAAANGQKTASDYLIEGYKYHIIDHDYAQAVLSYHRAWSMELDPASRTLSRNDWLDLTDNLATCYRMLGSIRPSIAVLEAGIREEPLYPMFHYDLARDHGEMRDEVKAIKELRSAFLYRENMTRDRKLPDPMLDESFKTFWRHPNFKKAVDEMKKPIPGKSLIPHG